MQSLSEMKIEKLKIKRDTMLTLKRMNIDTLYDLSAVSNSFFQDVGNFLYNVREYCPVSILFDISTLLESIQNNSIGYVYDENIKEDMATDINILYPCNICECLSAFKDFTNTGFNGNITNATKYIQDIVESRNKNNILTGIDIVMLKLRFKDLHSYKFISEEFGFTNQNVIYTISESLRKLNRWIESINTEVVY
jgi:hypothetical protein